MADSLKTIKMIDQLIKEFYELNTKCREERVATCLELIKIHLDSCDKCNLKDGVKKIEW